jgi:sugar phosphate isomerase/epimerase
MQLPRIGCHLIVFGRLTRQEMPAALDAIVAAGYEGTESGPHPEPEWLKEEMDRRGLAMAALHTGWAGLDTRLEQHLDFLRLFGSRLLCVSGYSLEQGTAEEYRAMAAILEQAGQRAAEAGVRLLYHCHDWEFWHQMRGLRTILESTTPAAVGLCLDTHWIARGGYDPLTVLRSCRERTEYLHLKDYRGGTEGSTWVELGRGLLDWGAVLAEIAGWSLPWVMVEQDSTDLAPAESVRLSREGLRRLGW